VISRSFCGVSLDCCDSLRSCIEFVWMAPFELVNCPFSHLCPIFLMHFLRPPSDKIPLMIFYKMSHLSWPPPTTIHLCTPPAGSVSLAAPSFSPLSLFSVRNKTPGICFVGAASLFKSRSGRRLFYCCLVCLNPSFLLVFGIFLCK